MSENATINSADAPPITSSTRPSCLVLLCRTLLGCLWGIFLALIVNLILTEVSTTTDIFTSYILAIFLLLVAGILTRDCLVVITEENERKSIERRREGYRGEKTYITQPQVGNGSYQHLLDDDADDMIAEDGSNDLLDEFDRMQKEEEILEKQRILYEQNEKDRGNQPAGASKQRLNSKQRIVSPRSSSSSTASMFFSHISPPSKIDRTLLFLTRLFSHLVFLPITFAILSLIGVLLCVLLLSHDWTDRVDTKMKYVTYSVLATSLLFGLNYVSGTVNRLVTMMSWTCTKSETATSSTPTLSHILLLFTHSPLLTSLNHIRLISICCFVSGLYFGHIFGEFDKNDGLTGIPIEVEHQLHARDIRIEQHPIYSQERHIHLDLLIQRENYYSYPLAALLGGASAFLNEYFELNRISMQKTQDTSHYQINANRHDDGL